MWRGRFFRGLMVMRSEPPHRSMVFGRGSVLVQTVNLPRPKGRGPAPQRDNYLHTLHTEAGRGDILASRRVCRLSVSLRPRLSAQIPSIAIVTQKPWAWHIKKGPNSNISLYPPKRMRVHVEILRSSHLSEKNHSKIHFCQYAYHFV